MNIFIDKNSMSQFDSLIKWGEHSIHSSYDVIISDGVVQSNVDLFLVGTESIYNELSKYGPLIMKKVVYVPRYEKSKLISQINDMMKSVDNYSCLEVIAPSGDASQHSFKCDEYYIKLESGARSLNTFVVDNTKCSASAILAMLNKSHNKQSFTDCINMLSNTDGVTYKVGNVNYENENINCYSMKFYAHEKYNPYKNGIKGSIEEFRIIFTDYGNELFVFERRRTDDGLGVIDNELEYAELATIPTDIAGDISILIGLLGLFQGSIDLLISNDSWTIVEMSNQYGMGDIRPSVKSDIINSIMNSLIVNRGDDR